MKITFVPQRRDDKLLLEKNETDCLCINGEWFNFEPLGEGETVLWQNIPCDWIASDVTRIDGEIHLALIFPCGVDPILLDGRISTLSIAGKGVIVLPTETQDVDA